MNKTKASVLTNLMILTVLCSCSSSTGQIRMFVNEYASFEQLKSDLSLQQSKHDESKALLIDPSDLTAEDITYSNYFIGGTDYCINKGLMVNYDHHDANYCANLHNREVFIKGSYKDRTGFYIIYKDIPEATQFADDLVLEKSNGGNCYRYETGYDPNEQYVLLSGTTIVAGIKLFTVEEENVLTSLTNAIQTAITANKQFFL